MPAPFGGSYHGARQPWFRPSYVPPALVAHSRLGPRNLLRGGLRRTYAPTAREGGPMSISDVLDLPSTPALSDERVVACVCPFCDRLRLCAYGRPLPNTPATSECHACGDVCVGGDPLAARKALAYVIAEFLQ